MIRVRLSDQTRKTLAELAQKAAEPIGVCGAKLALMIQEDSQRSFDPGQKGTPESGYRTKWAPWAKSTKEGYERAGIAKRRAKRMSRAKRKGRKSITHSLMWASGDLAKNIVAGYSIESNSRARVKAGVSGRVPYGKPLHEGTDKAGRNRNVKIPARPFVGITPKGILEVEKFIGDVIKGAICGNKAPKGGAPTSSYWSAE